MSQSPIVATPSTADNELLKLSKKLRFAAMPANRSRYLQLLESKLDDQTALLSDKAQLAGYIRCLEVSLKGNQTISNDDAVKIEYHAIHALKLIARNSALRGADIELYVRSLYGEFLYKIDQPDKALEHMIAGFRGVVSDAHHSLVRGLLMYDIGGIFFDRGELQLAGRWIAASFMHLQELFKEKPTRRNAEELLTVAISLGDGSSDFYNIPPAHVILSYVHKLLSKKLGDSHAYAQKAQVALAGRLLLAKEFDCAIAMAEEVIHRNEKADYYDLGELAESHTLCAIAKAVMSRNREARQHLDLGYQYCIDADDLKGKMMRAVVRCSLQHFKDCNERKILRSIRVVSRALNDMTRRTF